MLARKILRDRASEMSKPPEQRTTLKGGGDAVVHARTTLVLYHRDGAAVVHLDKGRPLVVGRSAPADVEIPDPGLSRQHARFTWDDHGIWVEDLQSTNGTRKNGERVSHARIAPGDEIAIGPVMVTVHVISSIDEELRGFDGHDRFVAALEVAPRAGRAPEPADPVAMVVKNPAMKEVMATVKRLAHSTVAVLIHGETGTGKEVVARAIHDGGPRRKQPLRCINCAAIPGMLIESVLFGHEQGAFTGADKSARGIFEQADGGTVLLDEIGELAAPAQAALLRVLETKRVTRVGGEKEIEVDVRVIAATHRDLEGMALAGRFRQDLLYRLNTVA